MTVLAEHCGAAASGAGHGGATGPTSDPDPVPSRRSSPVTIGRADHLRRLREVVSRPPALVLVEGGAGIGKTRLVRQWLDDPALAGTLRLVGHCTLLREPLPFGPVVEALAGSAEHLPGAKRLPPVTGALRPLLPELAGELPPAPEPLDDHRQRRHRIFRGVRDLLAALGPVVMVLEDVHWLDRDTHELLRYLVGRLPGRLTLVLTYRREDLADPSAPAPAAAPPPGVTYLPLVVPPLERDEVAQLARHHLPGLADAVVDKLYERTGGVPLAVEATLRSLPEREWFRPADGSFRPADGSFRPADVSFRPADGSFRPADGSFRPADGWFGQEGPERGAPVGLLDDLPVPPVIRDGLLERVGRLSGSARRLLQAAAVLARPSTGALLTRVAALPPSQGTAGLVELVERALLHPDGGGGYAFRHSLARQAVQESIAEPVRRQLHRRAVQALRRVEPPPLAELARHSRAAGQIAAWLRYAEAAADRAIEDGDAETAASLLHSVVTWLSADDENRPRLAAKLGRAALSGAGQRDAIAVLTTTLAGSPPSAVRGELRMCLGLLLRDQATDARQGRVALECAVAELSGQPAAQARAMASLGLPYLLDGLHVDDNLVWLSWAHLAATAADDPQIAELVRADHAGALVGIGDPAGWRLAGPIRDASSSSLPGAPADHRRLAAQLAWSATWVGHYRETESLLRAGLRMLTGTSGGYLRHRLNGTALRYDYAVGRWEGLATRARAVGSSATGVPPVAAEARLVSGLVSLATGDLRDAEAKLSGTETSVPVVAAAAGGMARLAAASGDLARARHWIRHGAALVRDKGVWCWAAELAPIAVAVLARDAGTRPEAVALLDEFATGVAGRDSPLGTAAEAAARAALAEADGDHPTAAERYAEAARLYQALPRPYEAARATEGHGRCLLAAGEDGVTAVDRAMAIYERLGATRDVARCRHLLRSLGRRLPHRRGRRGYGDDLSPRERDVVGLVRRGLTNREIAATLFLSCRTVEAHVARALRKLGLRSRRALVGRGPTGPPGDGGAGVGPALPPGDASPPPPAAGDRIDAGAAPGSLG